MKSLLSLCILAALLPFAAAGENLQLLPLEDGRQFLPRGYVMNTEAGHTIYHYTAEDYARAVRLGANYQVIRLALGKLGGWPGLEVQPEYLQQLDHMVGLARAAGMRTGFKMTVYDPYLTDFDWGDLWRNENGEQDAFLQAWRAVWERYKDDPLVVGYDLINEPDRGGIGGYYECIDDYLIPFYRVLIDELHQISPEKWAMYQTILYDHGDPSRAICPFVEMYTPINRERLIYAAHTYETSLDKIAPTFRRYMEEAKRSNAKLMLGEWGPATVKSADHSLDAQQRYQEIYRTTTKLLDDYGLGAVKAWFSGSILDRTATWAIFMDPHAAGTSERKFITDIIARPTISYIAGQPTQFGYDYATRTFTLRFTPDYEGGASEIFVGADRHYPDGFSVFYGGKPILAYDPWAEGGLQPIESIESADAFAFEPKTQRLTVQRWPQAGEGEVVLQIVPGTTGYLPPPGQP